MPELVTLEWLEEHLGSSDVQVVDPRTRERYLSGHAAGALHVPLRAAFDPDSRLRDDGELAAWLSSRGVDGQRRVAIYDDYDGQKGAMLAWILEYLGHPDVVLVDAPFARWAAGGRELFYRPVQATPSLFRAAPRAELRVRREGVSAAEGLVIDVRSADEFGSVEAEDGDLAGHVPGAVNVPWRSLVEDGERLFVRPEAVVELVRGAAGRDVEPAIVYYRSGLRAAVALVALQAAGLPARLYDGSYLDWTREGMPIELATPTTQ